MRKNRPVDYLAAMKQLRQKDETEKHQIHAPDFIPIHSEKPVDYLAISKAWDKEQAGQYTIYTVDQQNESTL